MDPDLTHCIQFSVFQSLEKILNVLVCCFLLAFKQIYIYNLVFCGRLADSGEQRGQCPKSMGLKSGQNNAKKLYIWTNILRNSKFFSELHSLVNSHLREEGQYQQPPACAQKLVRQSLQKKVLFRLSE